MEGREKINQHKHLLPSSLKCGSHNRKCPLLKGDGVAIGQEDIARLCNR